MAQTSLHVMWNGIFELAEQPTAGERGIKLASKLKLHPLEAPRNEPRFKECGNLALLHERGVHHVRAPKYTHLKLMKIDRRIGPSGEV
jgi:hypothetical protein